MALVSALGSSITYLQAYQQAKEMAIGSQMKASSIKGSTAGAQIQRAAYKVQSQAYAAKAIALEKQAYQEIQNAANSAKYTNTISYNAPASSSSGSGSGFEACFWFQSQGLVLVLRPGPKVWFWF